jgi:myo-inositol 2-dehydrogenase/D-chiro-inositol 1-dehydrogenase
MRRFDPGYAAAKARIEAGTLGRIETFRALSRDTYPPSVEFLRTSGGLFLDMAVHDLDLARFLVGEVDEVQAWGSVLFDERFAQADDIDTAVIMLRFVDGALGVVETARHSSWGYDIRTEVAGAKGKVVVEAPQKTPVVYSREFGFEADHFENFPDRFEVAFRLELEAFFRALGEGRTPTPGPEDALETLRLAVAATRSWREGRPVRVAEVTA